ncbi:MAG: ComF family protein [Synechococcaceae cyanobacterium]|nr:ComF family protein [Synechococcaceae cyanobacterium]
MCSPCLQRLALPTGGLQGSQPLPWWSCGSYRGALRSQLLGLRRRPDSALLQALLPALLPPIAALEGEPWLVPVPSWKRRANPLPELLVQALSQRSKARGQGLLRRSRPVLGQHHLNRTLRELNQIGSFQALRPAGAGESRRHPLLVVDDILTTGATAFHAAACLEAAGWRVGGLLCLARTPAGGGR